MKRRAEADEGDLGKRHIPASVLLEGGNNLPMRNIRRREEELVPRDQMLSFLFKKDLADLPPRIESDIMWR